MNLFERLKYNHRYSAMDSSYKVKAELYLFNKYTFTRRDVPNTTVAAYDTQQNWYKALSVKPSDKTDIDVEHKKWVLEHSDDVEKLYRFQNAYNAASTYYNRMRIKYSDEIQILCIRHLININSPSYSDLLILTNEKKLEKIRIDEKYTKLVLQDKRRAAYIDKYIKDTGYQPSYIIENLDKLDNYITNCIRIERKAKYDELKKKYPDGIAAYEESHRFNLSEIVENAEEIKRLDAIEKRYKVFLAKHGDIVKNYIDYHWEKNNVVLTHEQIMEDAPCFSSFNCYYQYYLQSLHKKKFPKECRALVDGELFNKWGCYPYYVNYSKQFDFNDETVSGRIKIWQLFLKGYCLEKDLDYSHFPSVKQCTDNLTMYSSGNWKFIDSVYDKIASFIEEIYNNNHSVYVVFGRSGVDTPRQLNNDHFHYLEEKLKSIGIAFCQIDDIERMLYLRNGLEIDEKNIRIIVVELITDPFDFHLQAKELIEAYPDRFVNIMYISLIKEYTRQEMKKLIDEDTERRRKEEEDNNRIVKAKTIANSNPRGFRLCFPDINADSISIINAQNIIDKRKEIEYKETLPNRLKSAVSGWDINKLGLPYYFFYWYYPVKYDDVTDISDDARFLIYNFKDGLDHSKVLDIVSKKLNATFNAEDLKEMVFVCVPASDKTINSSRYRLFQDELFNKIGIKSGFSAIRVTSDRQAAHLTASHTSSKNYEIDKDFFKDKCIIVFDDVVTRGRSMRSLISELNEAGGIVICAMSIGRTYSDYNGHVREKHPWTGTY